MNNINYTYLRPKKAASLQTMYESPFPCRQDLQIWQGDHATIFPLREVPGDPYLFGRGGVVDKNGEYILLSSLGSHMMEYYPCDNPVYKDEKVVYCGYLVQHWGHFLVEAVTRLWYALKNDPSVDKYVFFLQENEEREIKGNYREFFELLKIWDKLEIINVPTTYREVIVPEMSFRCLEYYSDQYTAVFDAISANISIDPAWVPEEKIFFTRSNFAKDNGYEFGLDLIDNYYSNNGYAVLAPEKISLSKTIFYIHNAKEIASISGSTPHNMLFARDGQPLVMIERLVMNDDYQISINRIRKLDVTHVDANYHIYSVDWCGPYLLSNNNILKKYTADHRMVGPDDYYNSDKYLDKSIKQYLRSYHDNYQYRLFMQDWYPQIFDTIWEAYQDSYAVFKDYLDGNKPFLREHYFQWHYFKQLIKRLLHKA